MADVVKDPGQRVATVGVAERSNAAVLVTVLDDGTLLDRRSVDLTHGLVLASIGTCIGVAGAVAAGRVLRELLYGVSPLDGATLVAVTTLVGIVALVATIHPAARAARTDPAVALRAE